MELVAKIFETLEINQLALVQFALVVVLAFVLSATLIKPILAVFQERDNRTVKPVDEAKKMLASAESANANYIETLRKTSVEALARKRRAMDEAGKAERKTLEGVLEESNKKIEAMKAGIAAEKEAASRQLRSDVARLSVEIAEKVLGRQMA
jgi:F-type H+-transporting ATPase subunit b